jgi:hypothetical protein
MAAAVVAATLPGLRFYHDGQLEGRAIRLPVQLGREPAEPVDPGLRDFYDRLLTLAKEPVIKHGDWAPVQIKPCGDETFQDFLAYTWSLDNQRRLIVVNFSDHPSRCHVRLNRLEDAPERIAFEDLLHGRTYEHSRADLERYGLYVELNNFGAHVFRF